MRKIFWCSALALSLLAGGGACRKKDERLQKSEKAVEKSTEDLKDQRKELDEAQQDLNKERNKASDEPRDMDKKEAEVREQESDVTAAEGAQMRAKDDFVRAAKDHLGVIDARIRDLETRADASAKDYAARLRDERNTLANKIDNVDVRAAAGWDDFKKDVDTSFQKLDKDVDAAMRGEKAVPDKAPLPPIERK